MNWERRKQSEEWAKTKANEFVSLESDLTFSEWCYQKGRNDQKEETVAYLENNIKENIRRQTLEELEKFVDENYENIKFECKTSGKICDFGRVLENFDYDREQKWINENK